MRSLLAVSVSIALAAGVARAGSAGAAGPRPLTARGAHGAVATDQYLASASGLRVLRAGGNAVDAAVAVGYTLAVTFPGAGNLGGGGFMLVRLANGDAHFIDFRETAPAAAMPAMYLDRAGAVVAGASTDGARSSGVPGSVAGLDLALATFGTLPRSQVMRDAIDAAERGFPVTDDDAATFARGRTKLRSAATTRAVFIARGTTPAAGTIFRQPDLARTLRAIARDGDAGFYRGDVARRLVRSEREAGGIITEADLAAYRAVEREPLRCPYRGTTILTAPLPSSGGVTICEIVGILGDAAPAARPRTFADAHLEAEAERRAFADRNGRLGDPAFVPSAVASLLDRAYLAHERASIDPERATPSSAIRAGIATHEGTNTTNYSVVDAAGDVVDVTYTLNDFFGSGFVAGDTGVLMNDEMDDFAVKPGSANMFGLVQGAADAIAPGKRPLSSMSPSIVLDASGRPVLVTGAAGGPRIITTTLDVIRAVVDYHEDAGRALADSRAHMQYLPDVLYAESDTFDAATLARLRAAGYRIEFGHARSAANAAGIGPDGARFAAHDPRSATGDAAAF